MFQKSETTQPQPTDVTDEQRIVKRNVKQNNAFNEPYSMHSHHIKQQPFQQDEVPSGISRSSGVLITVLMPCLNEAMTLADCIQHAHRGCQIAIASLASPGYLLEGSGDVVSDGEIVGSNKTSTLELSYEILIADNGSSDGSIEIAIANGAKVVCVAQKGYGAALREGIAAARGKYIIMGDSDASYDFGEVPRFLDKLLDGFDLVIGNRFAGRIMPGAMPWHHRYIGNPVLSQLGRLLYRCPVADWHCGLRAGNRERLTQLELKSSGMEFASEMIACASIAGYRFGEIPIILNVDGRDRPPHLRSFRDGLRHIVCLLRMAPVLNAMRWKQSSPRGL